MLELRTPFEWFVFHKALKAAFNCAPTLSVHILRMRVSVNSMTVWCSVRDSLYEANKRLRVVRKNGVRVS